MRVRTRIPRHKKTMEHRNRGACYTCGGNCRMNLFVETDNKRRRRAAKKQAIREAIADIFDV